MDQKHVPGGGAPLCSACQTPAPGSLGGKGVTKISLSKVPGNAALFGRPNI